MKSLRTRLFLQVGLIIVLFALGVVVVNAVCLEPFYVWQEKHMLAEQAKVIDRLQISDYNAVALQLEEIEKTRGVLLLVIGPDQRRKYATSFLPDSGTPPEQSPTPSAETPPPVQPESGGPVPEPGDKRNPHDLPFAILQSQTLTDGSSYQIQQDNRMNVRYLSYRRTLQNGDVLELRVTMNSVQKSVAIANRFLLGIGGAALLLALAWAYRFSRQFTQPILEMNEITRSMARLDFHRRCQIGGQDEVGELGHSINHLSDRLDWALTDLKLKNEQLEQDIARERKLDQMRREFVQNVSHELKTPLCIIQGYAEGLRLNVLRDDTKRQHYTEVIVDETQRMDKLVHELLQLSQFESGQFPIERTRFNLTQTVGGVITRFEPLLEQTGVNITNRLQGQLWVEADELRVGQILVNYLDNAIAHATGDREIIVSDQVQGDCYRLSVFNSGEPIAASDLEQVWTSFYRADKARSRAEGRYGLGLSIVRAIQELHGTAYGVENVRGGVSFWFDVRRYLPPGEGDQR